MTNLIKTGRSKKEMTATKIHTPVLLEEVVASLALTTEGVYVDATFGRGGHAAAILPTAQHLYGDTCR